MTQTKIAKIIESLQDNDLACSVISAIVSNDSQKFLEALHGVNLTVNDLTLSEDEFNDFVRGVTSTGVLDIATWGGYYEASQPKSADPFTLLILSSTKKVYWGSRGEILHNPTHHAIAYTLTKDGQLEFTTTKEGKISITLTRQYADDVDTIKVQFKGTHGNNESIAGGPVVPPVHGPKAILSVTYASVYYVDGDTSPSLGTMILQHTWSLMDVACKLWGVFSVGRYLYLKYRKKTAVHLNDSLEEATPLIEECVKDKLASLTVDFTNAHRQVTADIIIHINQILHDTPPDFTRNAQDITEDLRLSAQNAAVKGLRNYVENRLTSQIKDVLSRAAFLKKDKKYFDDLEEYGISHHVDPNIGRLPQLMSYDSVVRPLVLAAREKHFKSEYQKAQYSHNDAELKHSFAKEARDKIDAQIKEIEEKLKKDNNDVTARQKNELRKHQLADELKTAQNEEKERQKALEKANDEMEKKKVMSEKAKDAADKDTSKKEWDKKIADAFK
ncbi:hypothetical protein K439DRAFT_956893 [Ramaria rubella]|nr:hypothetical protein K439DRAFT_956893 [Ramaria rubella]